MLAWPPTTIGRYPDFFLTPVQPPHSPLRVEIFGSTLLGSTLLDTTIPNNPPTNSPSSQGTSSQPSHTMVGTKLPTCHTWLP
jgi:hypothetical protein